jgi:two-component system, NarL family, invasion response regulator UvrY
MSIRSLQGTRPNVRGRTCATERSASDLSRSKIPAVNFGNVASKTTVLVAVESAQVREALVAMLGALDRFRVVAEVDNADEAVEAARSQLPNLALIEPELSGCGGWWAIKEIEAERLAGVVVALGRRADCGQAQLVGARTYVQMGTSPRELLDALEAAIGQPGLRGSGAQAEQDLLADTHTVLDKPALVDL